MVSNFSPSFFSYVEEKPSYVKYTTSSPPQHMLASTLVPNTLTPSSLNKLAFSNQNIKLVHEAIINSVKNKKGVNIGKQSDEQLRILMEKQLQSSRPFSDYSDEQNMAYINSQVIDIATNVISNNITEHLHSVRSFEKNPVNELPLPILTMKDSQKSLPGFINKYW